MKYDINKVDREKREMRRTLLEEIEKWNFITIFIASYDRIVAT